MSQKSGKVSFIVQVFSREPTLACLLVIWDKLHGFRKLGICSWLLDFVNFFDFLLDFLLGFLLGLLLDDVLATIGAFGIWEPADWNRLLIETLIVMTIPNAIFRAEIKLGRAGKISGLKKTWTKFFSSWESIKKINRGCNLVIWFLWENFRISI